MLDSNACFKSRNIVFSLVVILVLINFLVVLFYYNGYSIGLLANQQIQTQTEMEISVIKLSPDNIISDKRVTLLPREVLKAPDINFNNPYTMTVASNSTSTSTLGKILENCPDLSPLLVGPLRIEFSTPVSLDTVKKENPKLQEGGRYKPADCVALQKVAVIIPFRHREEHLKFWLHYLHPLLQRQQLDYGIYVIEQPRR
ncbi:hypothetical protein UPYG_G00044590 [Umbra pygmaea]|uniref:Galactosyltransferase N-terminal domain-containing protein n=1 Tax=Umbra pygmaea TaxID=75934 RepID=A0ABD0XSZ2_UMBPY